MKDQNSLNTPMTASDEQIAKFFDDEIKPAQAFAEAMKRIEALMSTTKRHGYEFERWPVGCDLGWRCHDPRRLGGDAPGDNTFGYGLDPDQAYADYVDNLPETPRAGRVVHSSPFEPPEYKDDDVTFDDDLEDRDE